MFAVCINLSRIAVAAGTSLSSFPHSSTGLFDVITVDRFSCLLKMTSNRCRATWLSKRKRRTWKSFLLRSIPWPDRLLHELRGPDLSIFRYLNIARFSGSGRRVWEEGGGGKA